MKKLEKLLLINWHYFAFESFKFDQINFLTGKNASGKTTIIDAIQLLILGDTTGHFFNKSASDKSSRSLKGYLKCEIADQEDGTPLYLRNGRFSSYIALQFYDDYQDSHFTLGIVFDTYDDGSYDYKYFCFGSKIPDDSFITNNIPLDQKALRIYLMNNSSDVSFFETNQLYRDFIKVKFGNLTNSFFSLFKKAIPFTPILNIETFITEYVCDVKNTIDITSMQENIRNYKSLEIEAEELVTRVEALSNINTRYASWNEQQENVQIKKYILQRSELYVSSKNLERLKLQLDDLNEETLNKIEILGNCDKELIATRNSREKLIEEKYSSDVFKRQAQYVEEEAKIQKQINGLNDLVVNVRDNLSAYVSNWNTGVNIILNKCNPNVMMPSIIKAATNTRTAINNLNFTNNTYVIEENKLFDLQKSMSILSNEISHQNYALRQKSQELNEKLSTLKSNNSSLSLGNKNYDPRLLAFKELIEKNLFSLHGKRISVSILADLLDIKDEAWRNSIETYLGSQRFYLIVDPAYVDDAIKIYDDNKKIYHISDYGIVDTDKVFSSHYVQQKNSLAEELICKNEFAQAYINMVIGSLIKCYNINELRNNPRSITKDGMLYQSFVARTLPIERMTPYIGSGANNEQIKNNEYESEAIKQEIISIATVSKYLDQLENLESLNTNEVNNIIHVFESTKELPELIKKHDSVIDIINSLKTNYIETIENKIKILDNDISNLEIEKGELTTEIATGKAAANRINNEELPSAKIHNQDLRERLSNSFDKPWVLEKGEPGFIEMLNEVKDPSILYARFKGQIDSTTSQLSSQWKAIIELRIRYNTTYKTNNDPSATDNVYYDNEYHELSDIRLAEYKDKILAAKENAMKEFRNDFLAKLKSNFDTVISQINSLNDALASAQFGNDTYYFIVAPRPEYRDYYDMINDPLLLQGNDIEAEQFHAKYADTIENLFRQITFVDMSLNYDVRSELEKNVEQYTDYRSYLKFDLVVTDYSGNKQHLSRTLLKKSGGETQTPFYISVLASFSQAYRINLKNEKNSTIRLIIFDEAFSKMDAERITESVKLLRSFGLQAIVSAPSEKLSEIAPLVDKTLCVIRNNTSSRVCEFSKEEITADKQ